MRAEKRPIAERLAEIGTSAERRFGLRMPDDSMGECFPRGVILECVWCPDPDEVRHGARVVLLEPPGSLLVRELRRLAGGPVFVTRSREWHAAPIPADQVAIIGIVVASIWPE